MQGYMHFIYLNYDADYAVYPCIEPDYPAHPINNDGPSIEMNQETVQPGYHVILSPNRPYALYALFPS